MCVVLYNDLSLRPIEPYRKNGRNVLVMVRGFCICTMLGDTGFPGEGEGGHCQVDKPRASNYSAILG